MMGHVLKGGLTALAALAVTFAFPPAELLGQGSGPPSFRPFWHVFAAYAIAWLLVLGWLVTIARRLGRVEERLGRRADQPSA